MKPQAKRRRVSARNPEASLVGKTALVTGAGVRVGRAIARALAHAGMRVAVHYNRSGAPARALVAELEKQGCDAHAFAANLRDPDAPALLVADVRRWAGGLDVLVNSAAAFERKAFADIDDDALEAMLTLNFKAPFRLTRAAAPLLARRRGVVVNILDVAAFAAWPGFAHYGSAKAALAWLSRCLAIELAPRVRVAAVAPGTVAFPDDYDATARKRVLDKVPLQRAGKPDDIARAVVFIARNDYVTGSVIAVDGGRLAGTRGLL